MLNKDICQKCYLKQGVDKNEWDSGFISCPFGMEGYDPFRKEEFPCGCYIKIERMPPKSCPYKLEHVITDAE
jgi:hypothetical protein